MKKILLSLTVSLLALGIGQTYAQDTKIRFFGQPEFASSSVHGNNNFGGVDQFGHYIKNDSSYKKSNFNSGNYVLFVTSQLSERVSVLSEVSFTNAASISSFNVQRLALKYYLKDYFSVRVGKMFTPIGYWNNQFTLGLVLQPTIQRPGALATASDGGVLQYHDTGIQFEGENITNARIFYKLMIANGVGYYGSNDKGDTHVGTTAQLGFEPVDGLKIIGSGMFDRIEKGKANPNGTVASLPDNGNFRLFAASVAYMNPEKKPELIAELLQQTSTFDNLGKTSSYSYYVYGGYKLTKNITPYALYNYTQAGKSATQADPYFTPIPVQINFLTVGVRYKFNSSFIYKLEYQINNQRDRYQNITAGNVTLDNGFSNLTRTNTLRMQFAFVF
jgi:hypothetical protein